MFVIVRVRKLLVYIVWMIYVVYMCIVNVHTCFFQVIFYCSVTYFIIIVESSGCNLLKYI
jgi:hypothetical protein